MKDKQPEKDVVFDEAGGVSKAPETIPFDMRRGALLAAGFVYAECCSALDRGEDSRDMFVPAIVEKVLQFLQAANDPNN